MLNGKEVGQGNKRTSKIALGKSNLSVFMTDSWFWKGKAVWSKPSPNGLILNSCAFFEHKGSGILIETIEAAFHRHSSQSPAGCDFSACPAAARNALLSEEGAALPLRGCLSRTEILLVAPSTWYFDEWSLSKHFLSISKVLNSLSWESPAGKGKRKGEV